MIKKNKHLTSLRQLAYLIIFTLMLSACEKDKSLKSAIWVNAKDNLNFANLSYKVENAVVTLKGRCASAESKSKAIAQIKDIWLVDSVIDQIQLQSFSPNPHLKLK